MTRPAQSTKSSPGEMMRQVIPAQPKLDQANIATIELNLKSRDDIPQILLGLQYIYTHSELRTAVFKVLERVKPAHVRSDKGRPGMDQWNILVLGVLRLGLNTDYDRLCELANEHATIRKFLGHTDWLKEEERPYHLQTIKDNLRHFTVDIYDEINHLVVKAGHAWVKKSLKGGPIITPEERPLYARADSFVVLTDVHFPTDLNLLYDAVRKAIEESRKLADRFQLSGWRQSDYLIHQFNRMHRRIQRLKKAQPKEEEKKSAHDIELEGAILEYLNKALDHLKRSQETLESLKQGGIYPFQSTPLEGYHGYIQLLQDQIFRRTCLQETIPHEEKIFSIFEPHTEWMVKGKIGVPVELGVKVCIVEDQDQWILHHQVMQQQTDDQVAVSLAQETLERFPHLKGISYDRGFHSQQNQKDLAQLLEQVTLPKKGSCNPTERERESSETFRYYRKKHSAIESAIHALEHGGLDRCPDQGIEGFKRYVSLAIVSRNIKRLGQLIRQQALEKEQRQRGSYKKSA